MKALCLHLHLAQIPAQDAASTMTWCSKKHKTEVDTATYFILATGKQKIKQEGKEKKRGTWEKKMILPTKNKTKAAKGTEVANKVHLLQCWV